MLQYWGSNLGHFPQWVSTLRLSYIPNYIFFSKNKMTIYVPDSQVFFPCHNAFCVCIFVCACVRVLQGQQTSQLTASTFRVSLCRESVTLGHNLLGQPFLWSDDKAVLFLMQSAQALWFLHGSLCFLIACFSSLRLLYQRTIGLK